MTVEDMFVYLQTYNDVLGFRDIVLQLKINKRSDDIHENFEIIF